MLFGLIYSGTVATYPKAIFATAAAILVASLVFVLLVDPPAAKANKGKGRLGRKDLERGRSRVSKDLRGGAMSYGSTSTTTVGSPCSHS